jgi:nucleotide-binding universal stress UspA family protein
MYKRILLAYDGSVSGQCALLDCHEIAQWSQAELTLIAVMPRPPILVGPHGGMYTQTLEDSEEDQYQTILDTGLRKLADAGLTSRGEVVTGEAVSEIARCARRIEADLIVVGHKHLDGWAARWWRGSISKALIEHAPCSVLVVITH